MVHNSGSDHTNLFEFYQDLLSRPLWKWKCKIFPEETKLVLVITDNPVCKVLGFGKASGTLMVPLSKKRILFGDKSEIIENCKDLSIREINFCLAAWSECSIYAANKQTLEEVVKDLRGEGIIEGPKEVLDAARKPLFGLPERIDDNSAPDSIELNKFLKKLKDSFGPSKLDSEEEKEDKVS